MGNQALLLSLLVTYLLTTAPSHGHDGHDHGKPENKGWVVLIHIYCGYRQHCWYRHDVMDIDTTEGPEFDSRPLLLSPQCRITRRVSFSVSGQLSVTVRRSECGNEEKYHPRSLCGTCLRVRYYAYNAEPVPPPHTHILLIFSPVNKFFFYIL